MKNRRSLKSLAILLLASIFLQGCISLFDIDQPVTAKAGETITITLHVEIPQTKTNPANRIYFGFLVPRDWNAAKNATVTYTSTRGAGKMTPVPSGLLSTGVNQEWTYILMSRFKLGANVVKDMEWVIFQSDTTYPSTTGGPKATGIIKIVTKVGMYNEMVKPGYFVTTQDGIDPANNPVYGKDLHITGGRNQLIDFSHPQVATVVPVRSVDNDYITITFDGNARQTPLTTSTAVFLQAKAYTRDQQVIEVTEKAERTRLAPLGDNKWRIQIWPRSFFKIKDSQSLASMEFYLTDNAGNKVGYDPPGNPNIYEFSD